MNDGCVLEVDGDRYETVSEAIVFAAAAVRDETVERVEPLYDAIDPDALESLVASEEPVAITFEYAGLTISATARGSVRVEAIDAAVRTASDGD